MTSQPTQEAARQPSAQGRGPDSPRKGLLAALILAIAAACAYFNSFGAPLIFDDLIDISSNPAIFRMWPPPHWFTGTLGSRPVITLTLAVNYAISGYDVWSYHAFNFAVHVGAAFALYGVVRRTLSHGRMAERFGEVAHGVALAAALIWMLHPMQVQAVTYIIQRCESVMGLFFLLTLYAAIRGWQAGRQWPWHLAAIGFCLLGVGSKQVMAAAPVLVLLWDVVFNRRSVWAALKRSPLLYLGMAACLVLLAQLILQTHGGMLLASGGDQSVTPWEYLRSQPEIVLHYLVTALWPSGLVLDYWWPVSSPARAIPFTLILLALAGACAWLLIKRNPVGYLGAWIFVILAPTSSGLAPLNLAFDHRMYLPLVALAVLVAAGGWLLVKRLAAGVEDPNQARDAARSLARIGVVLLVVCLGAATVFRNQDFSSELAAWADVVEKRPHNPRGYNNLGQALHKLGELDQALAAYEASLAVDPDFREAHINLGVALSAKGRYQEAVAHLERALALSATNERRAVIFSNLGTVMYSMDRQGAALTCFHESLLLWPINPEAHNNTGFVLRQQGRFREAEPHLREALRLNPGYLTARFNLGMVLLGLDEPEQAEEQFRMVLAANPGYVEALNGLGEALEAQGRTNEAEAAYRQVLNMNPGHEKALANLRRLMNATPESEDGS